MNVEEIKKHISPVISLSNREWNQLYKYIEIKAVHKNDYFLKEGQTCNSIACIGKGLLIYFKLLDSGKEITTDFAFEGEWVTDNHSRLNNSPSFINIKAIEDSELFVVKNENLQSLFSKIPKLEKLGRLLMEQAFIKIAQHSIDLQVLSAKERYIKLLQKYPEVFQKIPLYHIANYLGIAPKSLSRIRNEILNKE